MRLLRKNVTRILIPLFLALLLALTLAVFQAYNAYTQMVVEQQQQQLLSIARAVSQSLSLYISEQIRDIDILVRTPGFLAALENYYGTGESRGAKEYILSYMLAQQQGLSRVYLLDKDGNQVFEYNQYPFLEEFDEDVLHLRERASRRQNGIGSVFRITPSHYGMTLTNTILDGNSYMGTVVSVVDIEMLYKQFVASLNVGNMGYIMVKNQRGTVIMHPDARMLTFNYFTDIADLNTLPQYASLSEMLTRQYEYEEGTAIYRDYSNGILLPEDEIAAFSRMNLGGTAWYVSAILSYSEVLQLVDDNLGRFGLLAVAILALVSGSCVIIFGLQKNRQKLQMEAGYLRDINHTLEELHESRKEARHYQKLQTIGALAGGVVHEFNNLLTPIMGYAEFLKEQLGVGSEYYDDVNEIYEAGRRGKEIVDQILPFSRRDEDASSFSAISLHTVIRDAVKMVRMVIPSYIHLRAELTEPDIYVYGSATQIHQVLLNLCTNAYQSMDEGGGTLTLTCGAVTAAELPTAILSNGEGRFAKICVMDTGCGMTAEVLDRIFDPFFTTKEVGEGTGLGLSVVKNILGSHNGSIQAESTVGEGSCFTVYLPITQRRAAQSGIQPESHAFDKKQHSLMLVDDDVQIVRYLKRRFLKKNYRVQAFTDAEEALAAFLKAPDKWDLAVLDYTMPKYRGTELAQRMKSLSPEITIVLITGLVEREALQMQQEGTIAQILTKPLDFDLMLTEIAHHFSEQTNEGGARC